VTPSERVRYEALRNRISQLEIELEMAKIEYRAMEIRTALEAAPALVVGPPSGPRDSAPPHATCATCHRKTRRRVQTVTGYTVAKCEVCSQEARSAAIWEELTS